MTGENKDDGSSYIIDWSHVTQGNLCADGARSYLLFRLAGDEEGAEIYVRLDYIVSDGINVVEDSIATKL